MSIRTIVSILLCFILSGFINPQSAEAEDSWKSKPCKTDGALVFNVVHEEDEDGDPFAAGRKAAEKLLRQMGKTPLKAVLVSECFEGRSHKEKLFKGIWSVVPKGKVIGQSTYGSFTHSGCSDFDAVCLLGIGGDGVAVAAAMQQKMGIEGLTLENDGEAITKKLHAAGAALAKKVAKSKKDRLFILLSDAHSPKNQLLVEGVQNVLGGVFPLTGGSANKNAGQTLLYFNGKFATDTAIGVMLSGDFRVSRSGRKARDNDTVIATAKEAAAKAFAGTKSTPAAVFAFNCAGRRGKLNRYEDELEAIQKVVDKKLPLFGCYCAGEIGPVDTDVKTPGVESGGAGWHVMFTVIEPK